MRPFCIIARKCQKLLGPLCDLQAITGIGIIIAGWAQIGTINYYHEELVIAYWWLTLNSFWTGRADYLVFDSKDDKIRVTGREASSPMSITSNNKWRGFKTISHK
jgi:hypothetical protein